MALIAALKRLFKNWEVHNRDVETPVGDLVRQDLALLERAIGGAPYELVDPFDYQCRVVTPDFTVTLTWDWRDRQIEAHVRPHEGRDHPLDLAYPFDDFMASEWLQAQGLPTRPHSSGPLSSTLVRDELESVRQVVAHILNDDRKVRDALFYLKGRMAGYNDRVLCPKEAPPLVTAWTEERLRLSAQA